MSTQKPAPLTVVVIKNRSVKIECVILLQFIHISTVTYVIRAGIGTFQDFLDGCQRVIEPDLSPLLYKSIANSREPQSTTQRLEKKNLISKQIDKKI